MLERFKKPKGESEIASGFPDVKFFGFGNEHLPFTVGFDVAGFNQLLQDTFSIKPKDIPRITLRFIGFVPSEDVGAINKDIEELASKTKRRELLEVIDVKELVILVQELGFSIDRADPNDIVELIKSMLSNKLLMASISVLHKLKHEERSRKPISKINSVFKSPLPYIGSIYGAEYFYNNRPWWLRGAFLLFWLYSARESIKIADLIASRAHYKDDKEINRLVHDNIFTQKEGMVASEVLEKWRNLILVNPIDQMPIDL